MSANKEGCESMDERKQRILQAIIQDYVKSAEPVGSRTIARNYNLGISSATVRNEMYDLEQLGFLEQPHTSAGRIPSSKGYRFYVDTMLTPVTFNHEDILSINNLWRAKEGSFEDFFIEVAKLISRVSHNMSLYLAPTHDTALFKYIHMLPIDDTKAIMIVMTDSYALENEVLHFSEKVRSEDLADVAIRLTNLLSNTLLCDLDQAMGLRIIAVLGEPKAILTVVVEALLKAVTKRKILHSTGTLELLGQPEFQSFQKMQPILSFLEEKEQLSKLIAPASEGSITVKIGQENEAESIKDCSLIQANFEKGTEKVGTLAVLGPTRMEYDRIVNMLTYMQNFIRKLEDENK